MVLSDTRPKPDVQYETTGAKVLGSVPFSSSFLGLFSSFITSFYVLFLEVFIRDLE